MLGHTADSPIHIFLPFVRHTQPFASNPLQCLGDALLYHSFQKKMSSTKLPKQSKGKHIIEKPPLTGNNCKSDTFITA